MVGHSTLNHPLVGMWVKVLDTIDEDDWDEGKIVAVDGEAVFVQFYRDQEQIHIVALPKTMVYNENRLCIYRTKWRMQSYGALRCREHIRSRRSA